MFNRHTTYNIDGFIIELNKQHKLPEFQSKFPMYDKFLPFLAESFDESNHWIIDIGANVGDTAVSIVRHTKANILSVEPVELFYDICLKNIKSLDSEFSSRIILERAFIASADQSFSGKITDGTAVREEVVNSSVVTLSIQQLLVKHDIQLSNLVLIKSDTDGYDYDALMSAGEILTECSPILYYENQIDKPEQVDSFNQMVDYLLSKDYTCFYLFDNFGNYMCKTDSFGMKSVNSYLDRINRALSARTFYYVDVMVCKDSGVSLCENAINRYLESYR